MGAGLHQGGCSLGWRCLSEGWIQLLEDLLAVAPLAGLLTGRAGAVLHTLVWIGWEPLLTPLCAPEHSSQCSEPSTFTLSRPAKPGPQTSPYLELGRITGSGDQASRRILPVGCILHSLIVPHEKT